jgi:hypothetical protein
MCRMRPQLPTVGVGVYYVKIAQNVTATIDLLCLVVYAYY